jgi:hypothetical protein
MLKKKKYTFARKLMILLIILSMLTSSLGLTLSSAAAPTNGLVASWSLDEGTGTVAADSVGGANGTVGGAAWVAGKTGKALDFNGTDSNYLSVGNTIGTYDTLTVGMWVNMRSFTNSQSSLLTCNGWQAGALQLRIDSTNNIIFQVNGNSSSGDPTWGSVSSTSGSFGTDKLNSWHHVAVTYSDTAKTVSFYIDGVLNTTAAYDTARSVILGPLQIGGWNWTGKTINGSIDEVKVYNRVLTASEVAQLADQNPSPTPTPGSGVNLALNKPATASLGANPGYT